MKIEIHYVTRDRLTGKVTGFEHVANFDAGSYNPPNEDIDGVYGLLEAAWTHTQNLSGSWSKGAWFEWDGEQIENRDYDPRIEVIKPLEVSDGYEWGHRSSNLGDRFIIDGKTYEVDVVGFKEIDS